MKSWISIGAALGALAVILGAFGAHALKERLDAEQLAWWTTGVQYHMSHALALVLFGIASERGRSGGLAGAGAGTLRTFSIQPSSLVTTMRKER